MGELIHRIQQTKTTNKTNNPTERKILRKLKKKEQGRRAQEIITTKEVLKQLTELQVYITPNNTTTNKKKGQLHQRMAKEFQATTTQQTTYPKANYLQPTTEHDHPIIREVTTTA